MILECENKYLFLVVLDHYIGEPLLIGVDDDNSDCNLCFNGEWMPLNDYNDDLEVIDDDLVTCYDDEDFFITNVYIPQSHAVNKLYAYKKIPIKRSTRSNHKRNRGTARIQD